MEEYSPPTVGAGRVALCATVELGKPPSYSVTELQITRKFCHMLTLAYQKTVKLHIILTCITF